MPRELVIVEGVKEQTTLEEVAYTLDVTDYPGTGDPSSVTVLVFQLGTAGTDVTRAVKLTRGAASLSPRYLRTVMPLTTPITRSANS